MSTQVSYSQKTCSNRSVDVPVLQYTGGERWQVNRWEAFGSLFNTPNESTKA